MSGRTPYDAEWMEYDDNRRRDVTRDGVSHIAAGLNARCGAGALATLLRPEEEIEFKCNLCFPPAPSPSSVERQ